MCRTALIVHSHCADRATLDAAERWTSVVQDSWTSMAAARSIQPKADADRDLIFVHLAVHDAAALLHDLKPI